MDQRGWTLEKFGQRAGISTSLAHQIANEGKDNVRRKTFEGIAAALGMTPSQLRQTVDGDSQLAPLSERVARIARLLPDVPEERLDAIEQHVTLAVQPAPRAKTPAVGRTKSVQHRRREILTGADLEAEQASKRGQFPIHSLLRASHRALETFLSAFALNRDSGPLTAGA